MKCIYIYMLVVWKHIMLAVWFSTSSQTMHRTNRSTFPKTYSLWTQSVGSTLDKWIFNTCQATPTPSRCGMGNPSSSLGSSQSDSSAKAIQQGTETSKVLNKTTMISPCNLDILATDLVWTRWLFVLNICHIMRSSCCAKNLAKAKFADWSKHVSCKWFRVTKKHACALGCLLPNVPITTPPGWYRSNPIDQINDKYSPIGSFFDVWNTWTPWQTWSQFSFWLG